MMLIGLKAVAAHLGVSPKRMRTLARHHGAPVVVLAHGWMARTEELDAWWSDQKGRYRHLVIGKV